MDLTSECNRNCPDCPSTTSVDSHNLDPEFVERLFSALQGQTSGLLLTGGEPTMSPLFPDVLRSAREHGFSDIAIVTNGGFLDRDAVADALLSHATAVRVSLYDWTEETHEELDATLKRIETLRSLIEKRKSKLEIGASVLTFKEKAGAVGHIIKKVRSAGAHWIYFHPLCLRWDSGSPVQSDQRGVVEFIEEMKSLETEGFRIFVFNERYNLRRLAFTGYHTAHFLLVVGADGMNYLGAEVKYQPNHIIADLKNDWDEGFLWKQQRLEKIQSVKSDSYPAIGSRHRGVLYNDLIDRFMNGRSEKQPEKLFDPDEDFYCPHIL
ncbi:MAG: radical SAM protein [Deltaproteobacteria bacterium]|nr:radical SAM protein [Deltaproteobacteria bacterium]